MSARRSAQMGINMDEREIKEWIENKMPELVETLKEICRVRSVAEKENHYLQILASL